MSKLTSAPRKGKKKKVQKPALPILTNEEKLNLRAEMFDALSYKEEPHPIKRPLITEPKMWGKESFVNTIIAVVIIVWLLLVARIVFSSP